MEWALPEVDTYFRKILENTPNGFEIDHLEEALKYCTRFRTAVDGGAHIGTWSVHLATRFRKVLAFEPATDTYKCLAQNTAHMLNILPLRAALGARDGSCIVVDDLTRMGNTGSRMIVNGIGDNAHCIVPLDALDRYKLEDLDFLKLDVEGYEVEALKGAVETIRNCRPTIMVECKQFSPPRNGGPEATIQLLTNLGYNEVGGIRNDRVFTVS